MILIGWPVLWPLPPKEPLVVCFMVVSVVMSAAIPASADAVSLRLREGTGKGVEKVVGIATMTALIWAPIDFARLDATNEISNIVPPGVRWAALLVLILAYALRIWAGYVNTFFSGLLTIQHDRGHKVIDTGPYARVRHPGNAAAIVIVLVGPLVLNSLLALIPQLVAAVALIWRTTTEDRFLRENLEGYSEYAGRVRARLLPGLY